MDEERVLSEEIQEAADPEIPAQDLGEEIQETEPAEDSVVEEEVEPAEQPPERDFEKDAAFADMRRKRQEAEEAARKAEAEAERIKRAARAFGYDGEDAIDRMEADARNISVEDLRRQREEDEKRIQSMIDSNPELVRMRQIAGEAEAQKVFMADLSEIKKTFPGEQAARIQDIPNYEKFAEARAKGISAEDAYFLANREAVLSKKATAAKQAAAKAQQKAHMHPLGGSPGTDDMVEIPAKLLDEWKDTFPDATPKELKEKYNRALKAQE